MKIIRILAIALLASLAGGCAGVGPANKKGHVTDPTSILDRTWQWEATLTPTDKIIVPDSERYTVILMANGQAQFRFDCNRGSGSYHLSTGKISFGDMISTRMACPAESLDAAFMRDLQRIETFFVKDGLLNLEFPHDGGGKMQFRAVIQSSVNPASLSEAGNNHCLQFAAHPLEAAYIIEDRLIQLHKGKASATAAPKSAAMIETHVFGCPEYGDLNGDGSDDAVLILQHDPGGSGTFYYVAAAIFTGVGWQGSRSVLLGDRISPQNLKIRNKVVIVNYCERRPDEPMSAPPTDCLSKYLTLQNE